MILETTGTSLLVEDRTGDGDIYTVGPFDDDNEFQEVAKQLLQTLRPEDKHVFSSDIQPDDETLSEFKEACLVAVNLEGVVTMVIWDIDNREGI